VSVTELKQEVSRLSATERLEAMEWLWASLSKDPGQVESPAWHGEILAAREAKVNAGEAQFLSIDQLKDRLRR
jgi:putative addiction module component (TIGR02574 family)